MRIVQDGPSQKFATQDAEFFTIDHFIMAGKPCDFLRLIDEIKSAIKDTDINETMTFNLKFKTNGFTDEKVKCRHCNGAGEY